MDALLEAQILEPIKQGIWTTVPLNQSITIESPAICVIQNNMNNSINSGSRFIVKNVLLGLDASSSTFINQIHSIENFMINGCKCLWTCWYDKQFDKTFIPMIKEKKYCSPFLYEIRLNILSSNKDIIEILDENNNVCSPKDIIAGDYMSAVLRITGMWCSNEKCGIKYTVEKFILKR
jgi:hypothetical protein